MILPGESAAAGTLPLTAMGYRGIVGCDSGLLDSLVFQTFSLGIVRSFFIIGGGFSVFCQLRELHF